jgi:RNA polymerase sigma-70 factor (ECF subfamily)
MAADTTDEQLMLDVRNGSRDAFAELFMRYRDVVWSFFRRRVPDPARAEELTHDAFVAVLQAAGRYEPRGAFRAYLFGIAFNLLQANRRGQARQPAPLEIDPPAAHLDPDVAIWIAAALQQLDADDREILMLREYEQLSYLEIADVTGVPLNTVRSRLYRARVAVKALLESRRPLGVDHAIR